MDDCSDLIGEVPKAPVQKLVDVAKAQLPAKKRTGRKPMPFDQDVCDTICQRIADGHSLRSILRDDDSLPSMPTILKWLAEYPLFAAQYAHAREAQADTLVDEMLDIADNKSLDPKDRRVRIDTRKWLAGKMKPKKYGEKTLIGNDPDNPLPEGGNKIDVLVLAAQLRKQKAIGEE